MKKLFSVLAVLFVMGTANVFAFGIGAQGGYTVGGNGGGALTFKVDSVPCVFAVDFAINSAYFNVGGTADWWLANPKIENTWGYYYGFGVAADVQIASNSYGGFGFGPRLVAGTNVFLLDKVLELYLQAAYQPMFWLYANSDSAGITPVWFSIPVNVGFRVWF